MTGRLRHAARDVTLGIAASRISRPAAVHTGTRRVLVLQPDHLGDVLLSQPAVTLLRQALPDVELVGVVGPWSATMARMCWPVDRIVEVAYPGFTRLAVSRRAHLTGDAYRQVHHDAGPLRALGAEIAVVLRPDGWWATWLGALSARQVVSSDDPRAARFATTAVAIPTDGHAAERAAAIAAGALQIMNQEAVPAVSFQTHPLHLPIDAAASQSVQSRVPDAASSPFAVIHPGAGAAVKQWLPHRWPTVVQHLRLRGLRVVLTGSTAEQDLCRAIAALEPDVLDVSGQTDLPELVELLRTATVVVGPDSGPLHLAVATDTPSVHLFGPADPRRYGPWGDPQRHRVVHAGMHCARCGDLSAAREAGCGCMLAITTSAVCEAIDAALERTRVPTSDGRHG